VFRAFASRSPTRVFWEVGAFSNLVLLAVVLVSVGVQLLLCWVPATQALFHIVALPLPDALLCVGLGLISVTVLEVRKLIRRAATPAR
jgi:P-type Ca2+ transporter type 2C